MSATEIGEIVTAGSGQAVTATVSGVDGGIGSVSSVRRSGDWVTVDHTGYTGSQSHGAVRAPGAKGSTGFFLGTEKPNGGQELEGRIAEILVFDRALTDTELAELMASLREKYGIVDDIDGDGLLNSEEDLDMDGVVDAGETDAHSKDTDGDGLLDPYDPLWSADPVADAAALEAQPDGSLFAAFTFDAADGYSLGALGGQQGWEAGPVFRVRSDDTAASSDQALSVRQLHYGTEADILTNAFATARHYLDTVGQDLVWVSFYAKLQPAILEDVDLSSNPAAVLALNGDNAVVVYDSSLGDWRASSAAVEPDTWIRYDLELDYTAKLWKVCVAGQTILESIPFVDPSRSTLEQFVLLQQNSAGESSWIDEIEIRNVEPAGLDFDGDGLDNATERALGTDLNLSDSDGDGMGDLYESTNGLDPLVDDTADDLDGDGLLNYQEHQLGFDPQLQDVEGADGIVRRDVWLGISGLETRQLTDNLNFPLSPDAQVWSSDLNIDTSESYGDNYGQRIYGLIVAPETGDYTFWIAGDDHCELWLSSDAFAFNKERVAYLEGASLYQDWTLSETQQSALITLTAGEAYYFEIIHKEGTGNDHVSIAWEYGNAPFQIISSEHLRNALPEANDADMDGLPDDWELQNGLDATKGYGVDGYAGDPNSDGRLNYQEFQLGTDPLNPDTDDDGLSNLIETGLLLSDPLVDDAHNYAELHDFTYSGINTVGGGAAYQDADSNPHYYFTASGAGLALEADQGHFVHTNIVGDFAFTVRLHRIEGGVNPGFSLMLRESLDSAGNMAALHRKSDLNANQLFQRGLEPEGANFQAGDVIFQSKQSYIWLKMVREGGTLYSYASQDGISWHLAGTTDAPDVQSVELGVFASSGSPDEQVLVEFSIIELLTDADQDGIWDSEESSFGTSATEWDSDGDGYSDYEEIHEFYSNPNSADLVDATVAESQDGASSVVTLGNWVSNGQATYAIGGRGAIEYDLNVSEAAIYRLNILGQSRYNYTGFDDYSIKVEIDGVYIGRIQMSGVLESEADYGRIMTPWLPTGTHRVRFFIDNTYTNRSLQINSVSLEYVGGEDLDLDGTPDWMQTRLAANNSLTHAPLATVIESAVSPFCLLGRSRYLGFSQTADSTQELQPLPSYEFYANVELNTAADTQIELQFENNAFSDVAEIRWVPTDVLSTESMTIRKGDRLLLTALDTLDPSDQAITLSVDGGAAMYATEYSPLEHLFDAAGTYIVSAAVGSQLGTLTVEVLEAELGDETYELVLHAARKLTPSALSNEAIISIDETVYLIEDGTSSPRSLEMTALEAEPAYLAARLPDSGAVMDHLELKPFYLVSDAQTHVTVVDTFENGDLLISTNIVLDHVPDDLELTISIFVAGVTFPDGSIVKILTADDFDELGRSTVYYIKPASKRGSVCHRISVSFDGTDFGNL